MPLIIPKDSTLQYVREELHNLIENLVVPQSIILGDKLMYMKGAEEMALEHNITV